MMLESEPELAYQKDKMGNSALFYAVANGHDRVVNALLRIIKQVDDVEPEKRCTPLFIAATKGYTAIVLLLLQHGANPNIKNIDGLTSLHNAVYERHIDVVKLLLKYGANPAIKDGIGRTPLDWIQRNEHPQLYQLLDAAVNQK